ncbi:uncharacterized protein TNIN_13041 [Trichonephila inaurata madagascariensis]|uniref:Uncharacterized protein n=1 Tax=Trichonephila inaurata madagascariensis TaxID=2747483 RepID=A0A8X6IGP6_9ARAC|nr:uncharacterized protein TNIN_13041 [Trichonephila inaurata madagascariensis]
MFMPSLQHIALVKIAVDLHREPEIRILETELNKRLYQLPGIVWEDIIRRKYPTSDCPSNLQDGIVAMMRPISLEISDWIESHGAISYSDYLSGLTFFPIGTINRMETFKVLAKDEKIKIEERFWMACHYCVSKEISIFWNKLSESDQMRICERYSNDNSGKLNVEFVKRWIKWLQGSSRRIPDFLPAFRGQLTPLTLHKYAPEIRDLLISTLFQDIKQTVSTRSFVLPLEVRLRTDLPLSFPYAFLRSCLFWPFQRFFMESLNVAWDVLSEDDFVFLLHVIICQKILMDWRDFHYINLLRRVWHESPVRYKGYVQETDMFKVLTEIINDGCPQNSIPKRLLLHHEDVVRNAEICNTITDEDEPSEEEE